MVPMVTSLCLVLSFVLCEVLDIDGSDFVVSVAYLLRVRDPIAKAFEEFARPAARGRRGGGPAPRRASAEPSRPGVRTPEDGSPGPTEVDLELSSRLVNLHPLCAKQTADYHSGPRPTTGAS